MLRRFLDARDLSLLSSARITLHSSMDLDLDLADKLTQHHILLRNKPRGLARGSLTHLGYRGER
jgi:hypothetical protein